MTGRRRRRKQKAQDSAGATQLVRRAEAAARVRSAQRTLAQLRTSIGWRYGARLEVRALAKPLERAREVSQREIRVLAERSSQI